MILLIIGITIVITALLLFVKPLATFFQFESLNISQLLICIRAGFVSVIWYEIVKCGKRIKSHGNKYEE